MTLTVGEFRGATANMSDNTPVRVVYNSPEGRMADDGNILDISHLSNTHPDVSGITLVAELGD